MGLPIYTYTVGKICSQINRFLERARSQLLCLIGVESFLHLGTIANDHQNPDHQGTCFEQVRAYYPWRRLYNEFRISKRKKHTKLEHVIPKTAP